ncbi:hypothetical protein [Streptomyces sp. NPDC048603]|uniref:hypothetical protein n=1 Tax=Streptomyces sp. NPDC048603 TaxID=3365577 RepID=UPI0037230E1E
MRKAVIEFSATLEVKEDGDMWEGDDMTPEDARGWVSHLMLRGDKHSWNFTGYSASVTSVTYGECDEDD